MKFNNTDKIFLGAIILATGVNIFSDFIKKDYPIINDMAPYAFSIAIGLWIIFFILRNLYYYFTSGVCAVEAFILNSNNSLLLINHPFHKKLIPPGGRIGRLEFPNEGLVKRLEERIGLKRTDYIFDEIIHHLYQPITIGSTEKIPAPFIVQKERRRQRGFVRFHYDFIYVLRVNSDTNSFIDNDYLPRWVDYDTLSTLNNQNETFPDVLHTYNSIINIIAPNGKSTI